MSGAQKHPSTVIPTQRVPRGFCFTLLTTVLGCIDKATRHYLLHGFTYSFHTGFQGVTTVTCNSRIYNLSSALAQPLTVQAKIDSEVAAGRAQGPFPSAPIPHLVLSPIGLSPQNLPGQFTYHFSPYHRSMSHLEYIIQPYMKWQLLSVY